MPNPFDPMPDPLSKRLADVALPKSDPFRTAALGAVDFARLAAPRNPAELAVARLGEEIAAFEAGLSSQEEVGAVIVGAPGNTVFHIVKLYHLNMDILVFEGVNEHRKPQRLIQHVTQLSILLTALPKLDEIPRRIGFLPSKPPHEA